MMWLRALLSAACQLLILACWTWAIVSAIPFTYVLGCAIAGPSCTALGYFEFCALNWVACLFVALPARWLRKKLDSDIA